MAYPISPEARTLFMNNYPQSARITVKSGNKVFYITEADIEPGGLSVNRYSATGSCIELGSAVAAELSLMLSNYDGKFNTVTLEGAELFVEISVVDPTADVVGLVKVHYVPLGYFIVEGCPRKLQTISITALDRMVKFDKPVNNARLGFPTTVGDLLNSICSICGVELATNVLLNSNYVIPAAPQNSDATYRQYLQWIAQITGTCAFIDWEGRLRLKWYRSIGETITPAMRYSSDIYENSVTVGGVSVSGSSALHIFSDNEYMIRIEGNGLIQSDPTEMGEAIYNRLKGFTYTPFSAVVQPMPHIYPLDTVNFVDANGKEHTCIITDVTFSLNRNTAISGRGDTATEREHSEHIALPGGIFNPLIQQNELSTARIVEDLAGNIPTKTSQLTNDAGFVTGGYATCSTPAAAAEKLCDLPGFTRSTGAMVGIKFKFANTAAKPTLNVNSTGAAYIYNCHTDTYIAPGDITSNMTALFVFNGTQWVLLNPAQDQQSSKT